MKKIIYIIFFSCGITLGQEFQILIKDKTVPVPFAHIDFFNGKGTFSDDFGKFNLKANSIDSIKISAIGFKTRHIKTSHLKDKSIIFIEEALTNLEEIVIKKQRSRILKHKKNLDFHHRDFTYDELVVTYIPFPNDILEDTPVEIKNIIVNITAVGSKKRSYYPFKVNLFAVNNETNYPNITDSLMTGIITSRKKNASKKVKVNVEKEYEIKLPKKGIFVAFQTLAKKYYPRDTLYKGLKKLDLSVRSGDYNDYAAVVKTFKIDPKTSKAYSYARYTQKFKNFYGDSITRYYWKKEKDFIYDLTVEIKY